MFESVSRAIKSPQVLELSGIGDYDIIGPLGIPPVVDLPGVGRNMQDRLCCSLTFGKIHKTSSSEAQN